MSTEYKLLFFWKEIVIELDNMSLGAIWTILWILILQVSEVCEFNQTVVFIPALQFIVLGVRRASLQGVLSIGISPADR